MKTDSSNPAHLWIVDNGTDRVYEYNNAIHQANGSSKSATASFALAPGNTNPQGIADPPPVGQRISDEPAGTSSTAQALMDLAMAQLWERTRARASVDAAIVACEKPGRLAERSPSIHEFTGAAVGQPAPRNRPVSVRSASQPADTALDAALAEWDRDEELDHL